MDDSRFDYRETPSWRKGGKQAVHSTFVTELEDNNVLDPFSGQLEWILDTKNPILFDSLTKFHVEVSILVSTKADDEPAVLAVAGGVGVPAVEARAAVPGEWSEYTDCEAGEYKNFRLAPCWFDKFWKTWEWFHYNEQPKQHNESWYIPFELNTLLYWMMDKKLKDELCPEPWHPGRAVPTEDKKWSFNENSAWHEYSKQLLTGHAMGFTWIPLHFWPLFQGTNHYVQKGFRPKALPVPHTGKISLRAKPVDKLDNVIRIADGVVNKRYKLVVTKFKLCIEEARMNPSVDRILFQNKNKTMHWPGVCKVMRNEIVPAGAFIHTVKFEEVVFPEVVLIFALNKNVTGGSYKYQDHVANSSHFVQHDIEEVGIAYGGFTTSMSWPDFGTVNNVNAERNVLRNYKQCGLFGMKVDPKVVNILSANNGFRDTDFPHVAVHLVQTDGLEEGQPRNRTVPLQAEQGLFTKLKDLVLNFKFKNPDGAPANSSYIIYLGYTDTSMIYKDKKFTSPYGHH
jgi:hypothetical protein